MFIREKFYAPFSIIYKDNKQLRSPEIFTT
jgi:hypothetical protein